MNVMMLIGGLWENIVEINRPCVQFLIVGGVILWSKEILGASRVEKERGGKGNVGETGTEGTDKQEGDEQKVLKST